MTKIYLFPGQGSQALGMGKDLFDLFPNEVATADKVLGYSIKELCLEDKNQKLNSTDYTQPALYVVNALTYLKKVSESGKPQFVAGHSLGEYNALFAAGVFDFETGLKLTQKRGAIMAKAIGGGMAAIVGLEAAQIKTVLEQNKLTTIDIANYNAPTQTVISGPKADVEAAKPIFEAAGARMVVVLKVSGAFHSRYMKDAQNEFETFLNAQKLSAPQIPVISNLKADAYSADEVSIKSTLAGQISSGVRWVETIQLLAKQPEPAFEEVGPGKVLTGMLRQIIK
jgi:trans-AT polyketide synthase/acyltransferase/oxidoreductase domain-containing protein